jgi:diaminohydroxyphosphoribosylaminopyrimidine deaminase / 5-amino-6-(5-phosphoribosylamino)uracil reductase
MMRAGPEGSAGCLIRRGTPACNAAGLGRTMVEVAIGRNERLQAGTDPWIDPWARTWEDVPRSFRARDGELPAPWQDVFGPLRRGRVDGLVVVGQFGQSIDARIATVTGHSRYINGPAGLAHLHRLRALVDAVLIGVSTATADDPQLTVRRVSGPSPARVILDPKGRLPGSARVLAADGIRRLVITSETCETAPTAGIEYARLPTRDGHIEPASILAALARHGLHRILIEGGADTVSRFLAARCLDRLHITVAPIIIGAGRSSVNLPPIAHVDDALRAPMRMHVLRNGDRNSGDNPGDELLIDCDLSARRIVISGGT